MILFHNHALPWILVGPVLMTLAACPQKNQPATTDEPGDETTTSDASTTTTTADSSSSGQPSTTGETTAPSEPDTTSTSTSSTSSTSSTTTLDPDTTSSSTTTLEPDTTGGDACSIDLTPSLTVDFDLCDRSLVLRVTVHNLGTGVAPAGVDVTFFEGTDASGIKLGTKPTTEPLPGGGSTELVWVVNAPPAGETSDYFVDVGAIQECDVTNNSALVTDVACPG